MDSTRPPRQYMDFVGGARPRRVTPAMKEPVKEEPVIEQPQPRRVVSDFVRPAKPHKKPAKKPAPTIDLPSEIVKETTFASIDTDDAGVTSVEFGVIEETEVDNSSDYLHVTAPEEEPQPQEEKKSIFHKTEPKKRPEPISYPFLSSVSVPKRPLSASRPTGNYAGPRRAAAATKPAPTTPEPKRPRKKSSMPFIVIIILSVLLGVTLGALVYFVLPH